MTITEAVALIAARREWHPVLLLGRALSGEKPKEKAGHVESLLERHAARLAKEKAKRAEA